MVNLLDETVRATTVNVRRLVSGKRWNLQW